MDAAGDEGPTVVCAKGGAVAGDDDEPNNDLTRLMMLLAVAANEGLPVGAVTGPPGAGVVTAGVFGRVI